jgi:cytochrome c peroxidase
LQAPVHWRGDRASVEEQALKSPLGPAAFGLPDNAALLQKFNAIPGYRPLFERAFPGQADPVTPENWSKAIGAYERTLMAPAPFDDFLKGKRNALSPQAQAGLRTFMSIGCSGCHSGVLLGGTQFQKFGLYQDYWTLTGSKNVDHGRFDVTKNEADHYVFKVPSLRNVAMTAPYFHDGSVAGLPAAVKIMAKAQLDKELSDEETANIVAFLDSLTGKMPRNFIEAPILPPSVGQ